MGRPDKLELLSLQARRVILRNNFFGSSFLAVSRREPKLFRDQLRERPRTIPESDRRVGFDCEEILKSELRKGAEIAISKLISNSELTSGLRAPTASSLGPLSGEALVTSRCAVLVEVKSFI